MMPPTAKGQPMLTRRSILASAGATAALGAMPAFAAERENPMPEEMRRALERDPTAPVLGNGDGNITLSEFFDYNCEYCRKMVPLMSQLVREDPQLRLVHREWPVFGADSEFATQASLASLKQGKYWQFHAALLTMKGRAEEASVMRVARQVGLDEARLREDMQDESVERHITMSFLLGDHMGLRGTPSFVCGDEVAFGAMDIQDLRDLVARSRKVMGVA